MAAKIRLTFEPRDSTYFAYVTVDGKRLARGYANDSFQASLRAVEVMVHGTQYPEQKEAMLADPEFQKLFTMTPEEVNHYTARVFFDGKHWQVKRPLCKGQGFTTNYWYTLPTHETRGRFDDNIAEQRKFFNELYAYIKCEGNLPANAIMPEALDVRLDDGHHFAGSGLDNCMIVYKHFGSGVFEWTMVVEGFRISGDSMESLRAYRTQILERKE